MRQLSAVAALLLGAAALAVSAASEEGGDAADAKQGDEATFQGQKLKWKDDDGLEVKIVRPISEDKCKIRSQKGDMVEQYYKLLDDKGEIIGTNFGKTPYTFTLGIGDVIAGMDRAMTGMCIGEKRRVIIPGKLGFGDAGRDRDNIGSDQTLHYLVQLVDLFRPLPGPEWKEEDGLEIKVTHKIEEAECRRSAPGDKIHQHYKLHLADGTFIDSSYSRNTPFIFRLGAREVISGMDRAMTNMCEVSPPSSSRVCKARARANAARLKGEKRNVIIPPELGYGQTQRDAIPPNSTLYFDIVLHKLIKKDEL